MALRWREGCRGVQCASSPPAALSRVVSSINQKLSFAYIALLEQYFEFYGIVTTKNKLFSDLYFFYLYMCLSFSLKVTFVALIQLQNYPEIKITIKWAEIMLLYCHFNSLLHYPFSSQNRFYSIIFKSLKGIYFLRNTDTTEILICWIQIALCCRQLHLMYKKVSGSKHPPVWGRLSLKTSVSKRAITLPNHCIKDSFLAVCN